jgi:hypothetical protein
MTSTFAINDSTAGGECTDTTSPIIVYDHDDMIFKFHSYDSNVILRKSDSGGQCLNSAGCYDGLQKNPMAACIVARPQTPYWVFT